METWFALPFAKYFVLKVIQSSSFVSIKAFF